MKDWDFPLVAMFGTLCLVFWMYLGFEERRGERLERMTMRILDLAEQGKLTDKDAAEIQRVLEVYQ